MYTVQLLVYHYNDYKTLKTNGNRNQFVKKKIETEKPEAVKQAIEDSLDEVAPGKGYVLVKYNDRMFVCEKDVNNPKVDYVRNEVKFHPMAVNFD